MTSPSPSRPRNTTRTTGSSVGQSRMINATIPATSAATQAAYSRRQPRRGAPGAGGGSASSPATSPTTPGTACTNTRTVRIGNSLRRPRPHPVTAVAGPPQEPCPGSRGSAGDQGEDRGFRPAGEPDRGGGVGAEPGGDVQPDRARPPLAGPAVQAARVPPVQPAVGDQRAHPRH